MIEYVPIHAMSLYIFKKDVHRLILCLGGLILWCISCLRTNLFPAFLNLQLGSQVPSATTPGLQNRTLQKKATVGQKKPLEALGSSPPLSR